MEAVEILLPAILLLLVGLLAVVLTKPVKLSPIVGYLFAGIAIGPHGFGLIEESSTTHLLAELGVVFLLFDIGLHFSLANIWDARRDILGLGPLQVLLCTACLSLLAMWAGIELSVAIVIGAALALSSTAVAVQAINELGVQRCPIGVSATAVLIFQDICAIFLLILASSMGADEGSLGTHLSVAGIKSVVAFAAALLLGRFVIGPLFKLVSQTRNEESFTALALLIVLSTAAATGEMGLSLTLGAFLAGMIISETPYRHVIQTEVKPFRGLLLGFFFITVGMSLNTQVLFEQWYWVLIVTSGLLMIKIILIYFSARVFKLPVSSSIQLAFILAQGSEFAFVVLATASVSNVLSTEYSAILVAAIALSMASTPFLAVYGHRLARKKEDSAWREGDINNPDQHAEIDSGHIIIFGMNEVGRTLADSLEAQNISYKAFEFDYSRFVDARADGYPVAFGDLSDLRLADTADVSQANSVVVTQGRYDIAREIAPIVDQRYPNLRRYVSVKDQDESDKFRELGMIVVQPISQPAGVDMASTVLKDLGVDSDEIADWITRQQDKYLQAVET